MPIMDSTHRQLEIAGDVVGLILDFTAKYDVLDISSGLRLYVDRKQTVGRTNGTTPQVVVPPPASANLRHELADFYLVQTDAADHEISLRYNDNGTLYLEVEHTLSQGDNLRYT